MDKRDQGSPQRTHQRPEPKDDFVLRIMSLPAGAGARRQRVSELRGGFNACGVTPGSAPKQR